MKNKTLKNLIAVGIFAVFVLGFNYSDAAYVGMPFGYGTGYSEQGIYSPSYSGNYNSYYYDNVPQQQYSYTQQIPTQQYLYNTQQPYTYVQPQVKYIQQPVTTQVQYVPQQTVQYVPQQQTVQYVNTGSTQGASAVNAVTTTKKVQTSTATMMKNSGTASNTGNYVNYDTYAYNTQNGMGASAYGYNNLQQINPNQVIYDDNGVTALSVRGSGSFMPSSVFQWFLLILLILGIIIIARMVSKTFSKDAHGAPVH